MASRANITRNRIESCDHLSCSSLHYRRHADPHDCKQADQFAPCDCSRRQQEMLPGGVGFGENVMPMVKIVEKLRQLKCVLGRVGRLGGGDTLLEDGGSL